MRGSRRRFVIGIPAALIATRYGIAHAGPRPTARPSARPTAKPSAKPGTRPTRFTKVDKATLRRARTHKLRPKHVLVESDRGVIGRKRKITKLGPWKGKTLEIGPRLDIAKFGPALHAKLGGNVTGYAWQLRKNGVPQHNGRWEWSQTHANAGQGWTLDTRMHIASVSKLLTAMATAHVLRARNRNLSEPIRDYLPDYWTKGADIEKITFRNLLNHSSGFSTGSSDSTFGFMKSNVADGVAGKHGSYDYENMNFGLCRILVPVLWGWINPADTHGSSTDHIWDVRTTTRFLEYCQSNLFAPAGVSGVGFKPVGTRALAYRFPHANKGGWDSGDLTTVSGGVGFRISINELLSVMGTFRRGGAILPADEAQGFLDRMLGIDQIIDTPAGKLYNKNGAWSTNDSWEQSVAYFMPEQIEMAIYVNSPIKGDKSLRKIVSDTYVECLK